MRSERCGYLILTDRPGLLRSITITIGLLARECPVDERDKSTHILRLVTVNALLLAKLLTMNGAESLA